MNFLLEERGHSQLAFPKIKKEKKLAHKPNASNYYYNGKSTVISKKNTEKTDRSRNEHKNKIVSPSWAIFSQKDMGKGCKKLEDKSIHPNYVKKFYNYGSSSDKAYNSTGPSDNDVGNPVSELTGFKIMRDGKILHDETDRKIDFSDSETDEVQNPKFAASLMTISPNVNNISIPDMAWAD